jgi:hypothetical protein
VTVKELEDLTSLAEELDFEFASRVPMGGDKTAHSGDSGVVYDTHFVPRGASIDLIATIEAFSGTLSGGRSGQEPCE